jgi:hypothetical protein
MSASILTRLLTGSLFLVLFGCKKGMIENQADPLLSSGKQGNALTTSGATPDIYVSGSLGGQAVYWKNGQAVLLPGGNMATGIAVVGTDVHVCGYSQNPSTGMFVALYWENGVLTPLTDGTEESMTTGIGVTGTGNVYIAGYSGRYTSTPCYWKNGVRTNLDLPGSGGVTGPVFVATNDDVYIPNRNTNTYWVNGVLITLPLPAGGTFHNVNVNAVKEIGGVVYAVGRHVAGPNVTPLYWRGGSLQNLAKPYTETEANDIAVSATTGLLHFAGIGGNPNQQRILYWDTFGAPDTWGTYTATSYPKIALDGLSFYICGSEVNSGVSQSKAMYWQDTRNSPVYLTDGTSPATTSDIKVVH